MTDLDEPPVEPRAGPKRRSRVAPFVAVGLAIVFALLFVVFAHADPNDVESADTPLMGRPAPAAAGDLDTGGTFDLSHRKGSWVVLNFFDSTCVPCVQEHPALLGFDSTQDARGADGAELVTVVWGEHPDGARDFFADEGVDWPVVFDSRGDDRHRVRRDQGARDVDRRPQRVRRVPHDQHGHRRRSQPDRRRALQAEAAA